LEVDTLPLKGYCTATFGCCIGTIKKSETYNISGATALGGSSKQLLRSAFDCYTLPGQERRKMQNAVIKDANILGGEPVFRGTRVPFKILIDYLEGGDTLDQFLEQYPSVSRELAIAAIEGARSSLVSQLE
jgi:uncharacterized protein (DUF433 family)